MKNSAKFVMVGILLVAVIVGGTTWASAQDTTVQLDDLSCEAGQIAKSDGVSWMCADDLMTMQAQLETLAQLNPQAQVAEVVYEFEEAYVAGDLERVMALYADDVVSLPPGRPEMEGIADLEADFEFLFDEFTIEREFEMVDLQVTGDTATRRAEWTQILTPKDGSDPISETGKCMVGFKKVGADWKIAWEIWNLTE